MGEFVITASSFKHRASVAQFRETQKPLSSMIWVNKNQVNGTDYPKPMICLSQRLFKLKDRSPQAWKRRFFSDCTYQYAPDHSNLTFHLNWNSDKLPKRYQNVLSGYYLIWYINTQLNSGIKRCLNVDGEGQVDDSSEVGRLFDSYNPHGRLLIVTSVVKGLCKSFTGKTFNNGLFTVKRCSLVDKSAKRVEGQLLGEYELILLEKGKQPADPKVDHIFYIYKTNEPASGCNFEGNWGRQDHTESELNSSLSSWDHENRNTSSLIIVGVTLLTYNYWNFMDILGGPELWRDLDISIILEEVLVTHQ
ncbi:hypothetical protein CSKR_109886 [Clonorchis sinensis]|uniref:Uncharacterized protein n=1 Tax=Clonorchis sinensis TaxID=79923 RepID=A0A419PES8_CLOSI|nr:hypothetical protein CSKR_109886 [Clonorchis sinensis]